MQPEQAAEQLKTFSCRVPQDWPDAGKTLGSLHFLAATGATVVAIARADALTVSPGPYAELRGGDRILFVGDQEAREAVAGSSAKQKQHDPAGVCLPEGKETHMVHNEIHALDLAIIGAYLIAMVLIGLVVVKKVRSMDDYYLGGRSFGPLVLMATVCATIIGGAA